MDACNGTEACILSVALVIVSLGLVYAALAGECIACPVDVGYTRKDDVGVMTLISKSVASRPKSIWVREPREDQRVSLIVLITTMNYVSMKYNMAAHLKSQALVSLDPRLVAVAESVLEMSRSLCQKSY